MYHKKNLKNDCAVFSLDAKKIKSLRVLLTCSPDESSIEEYSRFMKSNGVTDVFCFCNLGYDPTVLGTHEIKFHHLQFEDGSHPPLEILGEFDDKINQILENSEIPTISIHCQAGMGRAPTMLAYVMISRYGWDSADSVHAIRKKRTGSINKKQLDWILYTKIKRIGKMTGCAIM